MQIINFDKLWEEAKGKYMDGVMSGKINCANGNPETVIFKIFVDDIISTTKKTAPAASTVESGSGKLDINISIDHMEINVKGVQSND